MRIAFLCKRRYMRHDVITDRYARLYELPMALARRGHDVVGLCLDYRVSPPLAVEHDAGNGSLAWQSWSLGRRLLPGALRYRREAMAALRDFSPDVVVGASDALQILLARHFARALRRPYAVDLYDNFESFGFTRLPGVTAAFRACVRKARLVTCVSQPLQQMVREKYRAVGEVAVLESTIAKGQFQPQSRDAARIELGLPRDAILVGIAGALDVERGIDALYAAFAVLAEREPRLHLVLAGVANAQSPIPEHPRIHYLGQLAHERVAVFYAALDVGVICIRDTPFGRYSFPQKAYEMAAMRIPLLVADVGAMHALFAQWPQCLYDPARPEDLLGKLATQIADRVIPDISIPDWDMQAARWERLLENCI